MIPEVYRGGGARRGRCVHSKWPMGGLRGTDWLCKPSGTGTAIIIWDFSVFLMFLLGGGN